MKTSIFKCPCCGSILIANKYEYWVKCNICNIEMKKLNDDFDLSEIVDCSCELDNGFIEEA